LDAQDDDILSLLALEDFLDLPEADILQTSNIGG